MSGFLDSNYIWVFKKNDERNLLWAFACSLALHFVLFMVLVIKPFLPIAGSSDKLDSIWLYPALTAQEGPTSKLNTPQQNAGPVLEDTGKAPEKEATVQSSAAKNSIVAEKLDQPEENNVAREQLPSDSKVQAEPVTEMVTAKVLKSKDEKPLEKEIERNKPVPAKPVEKLMDDNSGVSLNQRDLPRLAAVEVKESKKETNASKPEKYSREEAAKKTVANVERVKELTSSGKTNIKLTGTTGPIQNPVTSARKASMLSARNSNADNRQVSVRNSAAAEVSGQPDWKSANNAVSNKKAAGNPKSPMRIAAVLPSRPGGIGNPEKSGATLQAKPGSESSLSQGTGKPEGGKSPGKGASAAAQPGPKNEEIGKNPSVQPKRGVPVEEGKITFLPLTGDLKLEITGYAGPVITFSFREYLKSHRNRPMTRAESSNVQIVKPVTRTAGKVVEAVIGTAGEGVYGIMVAPGVDNTFTAGFSVRIYENRAKGKTRSLGRKTIKGKTVVARILMPEGIFWDDENYFSGNLEDSDSITKYNSDTGVVWKEYKNPGD